MKLAGTFCVTDRGWRRPICKDAPDDERVAHMVEIDRVTQHEPESLFSGAFWQACEREAAQLLGGLAGADE